ICIFLPFLLSHSFIFFFYCSLDPRYLHSFPTRRSSDLVEKIRRLQPIDDLLQLRPDIFRHVLSIETESSAESDPSFDPWPLLKRSEEHTSELQSRGHLVCRLLLEKKKKNKKIKKHKTIK